MALQRLVALVFLFSLLSSQAGAQADLSRYQDKNRLLLIFSPSSSDPRFRRQNRLLAQSKAAFIERDLRRFDLILASGRGKILYRRYHVQPGQFRVLLIGKDGHVAFGGPSPLTLRELSARIDAMPMRRDEMRRQRKASQ